MGTLWEPDFWVLNPGRCLPGATVSARKWSDIAQPYDFIEEETEARACLTANKYAEGTKGGPLEQVGGSQLCPLCEGEGGGYWGGFLEEVMFVLIWKGCQWKEVGFRASVCTHSFLCSCINSTNTIKLDNVNSGVTYLGWPTPLL